PPSAGDPRRAGHHAGERFASRSLAGRALPDGGLAHPHVVCATNREVDGGSLPRPVGSTPPPLPGAGAQPLVATIARTLPEGARALPLSRRHRPNRSGK